MMNYEIFKEVVKEKFMDYMPEKFKGMELVAEPVEKVNVTLDGIILREEGRNISPTIYINDMYKKYQDCGDLEETLMAACDFMERAYEQVPVVDVDSIMKDANEKIVFQLINTEQNKTFLEQVPHREFQDLSIVYKVIISADKDAVQSSKITNEFAKRLGMSEEQLFKCAAENTRRLFPPVVRSMNDIMREMFARDGMPQEIADMMIAEIPPEQTMWVISNEKGINGAASMLYENELHELAESLESDLYILPSSVHEVIAVSSDMGSPEMLAQMVVEVNMQEVSLDERLSNQVYHYDKDLRKLTLATDTPNKRLDGIVAEPPLVYDATISKKLIIEENDHAVKTRVPGTWGEEARYVWLRKENIMEIHGGKTMLTFLDSTKDYKLYDEQNRVVTTQKGTELYTHYDKVESSVRERYEKVQKQQKKTAQKKTVTTKKAR